MRKSILTAVGLCFGLTAFGASAAVATTLNSPDGAAQVWNSNSNKTFNVKDTSSDHNSVYGNWGGTDDNRLENHSGYKTTVSKPVSSTGSMRACHDIPLGSDSCSGWHS